MTRGPVFRFAPSPNGLLHLGHAYSALLNASLARRLNGQFLLRIENIDSERCRPQFIDAIQQDLAWLGIAWQEPVRVQSEHLPLYRAAAQKLEAMGLLYPCFATRSQIETAAGASAARDPDGAALYPGLWRNADTGDIERRKHAGEPFAMRLASSRALAHPRLAAAAPLTYRAFEPSSPSDWQCKRAYPEHWGDAVVLRKDTPGSYHLCVVVDDAAQGVTHVVRGADLEAATSLHRLLQTLLELPEPVYHHHRLVTGMDGGKLSKSLASRSLAQFRAEGASPQDIYKLVGLPELPLV